MKKQGLIQMGIVLGMAEWEKLGPLNGMGKLTHGHWGPQTKPSENPHMGIGQNQTTKKWTTGFSYCFHLPGRLPFWVTVRLTTAAF